MSPLGPARRLPFTLLFGENADRIFGLED